MAVLDEVTALFEDSPPRDSLGYHIHLANALTLTMPGKQRDLDAAAAARGMEAIQLVETLDSTRSVGLIRDLCQQAAVARYESGVSSPAVTTLERLVAACGRTLEIGAPRTSIRDLSSPRARRLRATKQELLRCVSEHGARNLRVFGSVARGEDRPDSDVDLLVDLDAGRGLLDLAELRAALCALLGERVDVATLELLKPEIAQAAAAEAVPL